MFMAWRSKQKLLKQCVFLAVSGLQNPPKDCKKGCFSIFVWPVSLLFSWQAVPWLVPIVTHLVIGWKIRYSIAIKLTLPTLSYINPNLNHIHVWLYIRKEVKKSFGLTPWGQTIQNQFSPFVWHFYSWVVINRIRAIRRLRKWCCIVFSPVSLCGK